MSGRKERGDLSGLAMIRAAGLSVQARSPGRNKSLHVADETLFETGQGRGKRSAKHRNRLYWQNGSRFCVHSRLVPVR